MQDRVLVIFDCDGVLVDSEPIVNRAEAAYLSEKGWNITPAEARRHFGGRTFVENLQIVEERLAGRLERDWPYELAMAVARRLHLELEPVPGVRELLETLQRQEVAACVASQSPLPRVMFSLELCGLEGFFDGNVFTASMVRRAKPAPDLFLHAAERMGYAPRDSVVIEDSPAGVRAAVAAGMRVLAYSPSVEDKELAAEGGVVFRDMGEVMELLRA